MIYEPVIRAVIIWVVRTGKSVIDTALVFAARAVETSWGTWISLVLLDLAVLGWALSATRVDPASAALPGEAP